MYKYNYSIIIPYRDKFDLFEKAIASIPDRSDIQIIIADNAIEYLSQEIIPTKCKSLVTYCRTSQTLGAGCARNVALKHVKGKYILFMDADDYYVEGAFDVFDNYLNKEFDIVFFKPTSIILGTNKISTRHLNYARLIDNYLNNNDEGGLRYRFEPPWCKLYKADFIQKNDFKFEEIKVNNDAWFSLMSGHNARKLCADSSIVYVLTEGKAGQSLVKCKSPDNQFLRFKVAIRINRFLKDTGNFKYRIRLLGGIKAAFLDFGVREMFRYIRYVIETKSYIF